MPQYPIAYAMILRTPPHTHGPQNDRCPICEYWTCRCPRTAVAR
jgi:hypothetical protein